MFYYETWQWHRENWGCLSISTRSQRAYCSSPPYPSLPPSLLAEGWFYLGGYGSIIKQHQLEVMPDTVLANHVGVSHWWGCTAFRRKHWIHWLPGGFSLSSPLSFFTSGSGDLWLHMVVTTMWPRRKDQGQHRGLMHGALIPAPTSRIVCDHQIKAISQFQYSWTMAFGFALLSHELIHYRADTMPLLLTKDSPGGGWEQV